MGLLTPLRAVALGALLLPAAALARPTLGLRLAWAPAAGSAAEHVPMTEVIASAFPVQADALWRWDRLAAGAYASWAPGLVGAGTCTDGASCSASAIRAGAQATWAFDPWSFGAKPWVGGGRGWEWASQRRERLGAVTTTRWNGPELAAQGGAAWRVGARFAIGPFALVGLGRYAGLSVETTQGSASGAIEHRAVHAWIHLGVCGTVDL